jgi:hypothetical protein
MRTLYYNEATINGDQIQAPRDLGNRKPAVADVRGRETRAQREGRPAHYERLILRGLAAQNYSRVADVRKPGCRGLVGLTGGMW